MEPHLLQRIHEIETEHWWFAARHQILIRLARQWVPRGGVFLDVGCGTGSFLEEARDDWDVWGLDASPEAVAWCHRRGLHRVRLATAGDLFGAGIPSCDAVSFFDVIEHLDDDVGALAAARQQLRPSGVVLITVPAYPWLWSGHDTVNHHRRRYTRSSLTRTIRAAGLEPVWLTYFNALLFPLAIASRFAERIWERRTPVLLPVPPGPVNSLLRAAFAAERWWLIKPLRFRFPFGLSVLAVARRSATTE